MKIKAAIATILATLILAPAAAGWAIGSWQGAFIIWGVIGTLALLLVSGSVIAAHYLTPNGPAK
jgi:hypothetical protein